MQTERIQAANYKKARVSFSKMELRVPKRCVAEMIGKDISLFNFILSWLATLHYFTISTALLKLNYMNM